MSIKFYYAPNSTASATEAVLAELGLPCERVKLDIGAGETKKPNFLKVNPNGLVPVIVHEGTTIWESAAITMYLGETFGVDAKLYPSLGPLRGEAMKWIVWSNVTLAAAGIRMAESMAPNSDKAAQSKATLAVTACLGILENELQSKSFLLGTYSLVDTHLHMFVVWLTMMQVDLTPFPNVAMWFKRCGDRPSLAKLMTGH